MKAILSTLLLLGSASALVAGPMVIEDYSKNPITQVPIMDQAACPCFDGKLEFGIFATGIFPTTEQDFKYCSEEDPNFDDAVGGGVSLAYYFTRNIGIDLGAAWFDTDSVIHNYTLDLVLRFPIGDSCIAPYVFVGGGVHTNSHTVGLYRAGGGVDVRFPGWNCVGLFADGLYTWTASDIQDYAEARVGMRMPF